MSSAAPPTEDDVSSDDSSVFDSDYDSACEDSEFEWNIAVTHKRNAKLREGKAVSDFFVKARKLVSPWDQDARAWLRSLPYFMRRDAIPLFENNRDGVSEDYQLHPSFSWLKLAKAAKDRDPYFYHLEKDGQRVPGLFIPLGRLFVNAPNDDRSKERRNSKRSRLTKWTGYEMFISNLGAIWMVFDEQSLASHAKSWYPVSCGVTEFVKCPNFVTSSGIACLLPALCDLDDVTFDHAVESIQNTYQTGTIRLCEVEKSLVKLDGEDHKEALIQDAQFHVDKGMQRAKDTTVTDLAQVLHPSLPTVSSNSSGMPQYTPSVSRRDADTKSHPLPSSPDPCNNDDDTAGILSLRPNPSPSNIEESQVTTPQASKSTFYVNSRDYYGRTPLWHAIYSANMVELDRLLKLNHVQLNDHIGAGQTPLSLAVKCGNEDAVKLLIRTGRINVNLSNEKGQLPLSLALRRENKSIIELLLETRQVDLHAIEQSPIARKTPLDWAVEAIAQPNQREYPKIKNYVSGDKIKSEDFERFIKRAEYGQRYAILKLFREYRMKVPSQKPGHGGKFHSQQEGIEASESSARR